MSTAGIRALKQNASKVVAEAVAGEPVTITDRGRPVARLTAIAGGRLQQLIDAGAARPARRKLSQVPPPQPGPDLSGELTSSRQAERY